MVLIMQIKTKQDQLNTHILLDDYELILKMFLSSCHTVLGFYSAQTLSHCFMTTYLCWEAHNTLESNTYSKPSHDQPSDCNHAFLLSIQQWSKGCIPTPEYISNPSPAHGRQHTVASLTLIWTWREVLPKENSACTCLCVCACPCVCASVSVCMCLFDCASVWVCMCLFVCV